MTVKFHSQQVKGHGRGKFLGFPTINLKIPRSLSLETGIYAAWVTIDKRVFKGALHYGPVPVFNQPRKSLEVFLLHTNAADLPRLKNSPINCEPVKKIRQIINFATPALLVEQIRNDVKQIDEILSTAIPPQY